MNEAIEHVGPTRVRIGFWIGRGWDKFVEDLGLHILVALFPTVILVIGFPFSFVVGGPMAAGLALVGLRKFQQGRVEVKDFFEGFRHFLPALLSFILIFVFTLVGLIFLIIPGLVILAMYQFTFHFMVDRYQDFWEAMESSRKLVSRDYFGFTLFVILLGLINLLGACFLLVGLLVTIPVTWLAMTAAYLDFFATGPAPVSEPIRIE